MNVLPALAQPLPLTRIAYDALRASILDGSLKSGEIYNEMALARQLGISRTPVREALLELSSQGLVTFLPRKGVRVNHFTERDVEEVFELRRALELAAVEKVASQGREADLSNIDSILERQRKAMLKGNAKAFLQADRDFHAAFSGLARNRRLSAILDNLRDLLQVMAVEALTRAGRFQEVIEEHQRIVNLVKSGQSEKVREAMRHHLDRSMQAVVEQHRARASAAEAETSRDSSCQRSRRGTPEGDRP